MLDRVKAFLKGVFPESRVVNRREAIQNAIRAGVLILLANLFGATSSVIIMTALNTQERAALIASGEASAQRTDRQIQALTQQVIKTQGEQALVLDAIALGIDTLTDESARLGRAATRLDTKATAATKSAAKAAQTAAQVVQRQPERPRQPAIATQPPQSKAHNNTNNFGPYRN